MLRQINPDFFIVGAPKCGTTSLASYLDSHPEIEICKPKEPNFFSTDFPRLKEVETLDEYLSLFRTESTATSIFGEASTWYLYSKEAVPNILHYNPNAKFIVMIRNPLEMFPSLHSQFRFNLIEEIENVEDAWAAQVRREHRPLMQYRSVCSLGHQVKRLVRHCGSQAVHFVVFDDMASDVNKVYNNVLRFLGAKPHRLREYEVHNKNKSHRIPSIERFLRKPPAAVARAVDFTKRVTGISEIGLGKLVRRVSVKPLKRDELRAEFRTKLATEFAEDLVLLEEIVDRDLGHWLRT